MPVAWNCK